MHYENSERIITPAGPQMLHLKIAGSKSLIMAHWALMENACHFGSFDRAFGDSIYPQSVDRITIKIKITLECAAPNQI